MRCNINKGNSVKKETASTDPLVPVDHGAGGDHSPLARFNPKSKYLKMINQYTKKKSKSRPN